MKFTYFKFRNFKGIENETLELSKAPNSDIFTLVGLNESGKTTILEAINYFKHKNEKLDVLELKNYEVEDIHSLIPINKRDNFNDYIGIEAGVILNLEDKIEITQEFRKHDITITKIDDTIRYIQEYHFEKSKHIEEKDKSLWVYTIYGRKGKSKKEQQLKNEDVLKVFNFIRLKIPSILYFPNFLFDFPEKIYLNDTIEDKKHIFYQQIIQDTLDALENDLNINDHLIARITSSDNNDKRNLNSLIGKLQKLLTQVIFKKWNQIFNKDQTDKEIVLITGEDDGGPYVEFNIKDDVDTYRISERSLGFRWFFVYILLTQFRTFRKKNKNALFLFDEPASNLHPSAQSELLKSFEKLPGVIYTTHSQYLINPQWLESTFVIKNEAIDYENEEDFNSKNTKIKVSKYREFAVKHPNQSNYFQPILEVLDFKPSQLELVPKVIFTEGKNDFYTVHYFGKMLNIKHLPKIVPSTSASNMETLISLYLGWGAKFVILLDDDREGKQQKERYLKLYGDFLKSSIFTLSDINPKWDKFDMEDLILEDDKKIIVTHLYPNSKITKNVLNRSIQELLLKNEKLKIGRETLSNFDALISALKDLIDK
ncbi:AAA family ATPase [Sphingobacterium sp. InxBP1]|uniref:ATP-dependent nuclease n=1 Tax=Sphingobacterium sp. InxBP1 TaxID=2870328 RepID=UPI0022447BF2|nr:AAA family ATPase [Sphingobacterium sp. InxBP1]MCW8310171.1 AAA family ATPase [Sphingobacterium sp. InxBP1]